VTAAADQVVLAALVPPLMPSVIPVAPLVSSETRMFSIDCAVRAQKDQDCRNALEIRVPVVSNIFAGKSARLEQSYQASRNLVLLEKSSAGKVVMAVLLQKLLNSVPFDVSIDGILVRPVQLKNMLLKSVPEEVSINGKVVKLLHPRQALWNPVPLLVSINGKLVKPEQLYQALVKLVPLLVSICGKLVRLLQPNHP